MEPFRLGILGLASPHARAIVQAARKSQHVRVVAIASMSGAEAFCSEEQLENTICYSSLNELLADDDVEAVYVGLGTSLHVAWCMACCAAGKHALVEKPLCIDMAEAVAIARAFDEAKLALMDATVLVHHLRTRQMMQEIRDDRSFGKIQRVTAELSFDLALPDTLGENVAADEPLGCVGDLGWFCARWGLLAYGPRAVPVAARASDFAFSHDGIPLDLTGVVYFGANGTKPFHLHCSYRHACRQRLEIVGSNKRLTCDDFALPNHGPKCAAQYALHTFAGLADFDQLVISTTQVVPVQPPMCQHTALLDTFARHCRDPDRSDSWLHAAVQSQAIVSALLESARQDAALVSAYLDPCLFLATGANDPAESHGSRKRRRDHDDSGGLEVSD